VHIEGGEIKQMPQINISAPKSSGERWKLNLVFVQRHHLFSRALLQIYLFASAVVHVSMRVFMCAYEGRGNHMHASNKHLSTKKLRGKMEFEFCVPSAASYVFVKRCRYTCMPQDLYVCKYVCVCL